jgi:hypothetical protein
MKIGYFYYILGVMVIVMVIYYIYLDTLFRGQVKKEISKMIVGGDSSGTDDEYEKK